MCRRGPCFGRRYCRGSGSTFEVLLCPSVSAALSQPIHLTFLYCIFYFRHGQNIFEAIHLEECIRRLKSTFLPPITSPKHPLFGTVNGVIMESSSNPRLCLPDIMKVLASTPPVAHTAETGTDPDPEQATDSSASPPFVPSMCLRPSTSASVQQPPVKTVSLFSPKVVCGFGRTETDEGCPKVFSSRRTRNVHVHTVHYGITPSCPHCSKTYSTRANLHKHITREHP